MYKLFQQCPPLLNAKTDITTNSQFEKVQHTTFST